MNSRERERERERETQVFCAACKLAGFSLSVIPLIHNEYKAQLKNLLGDFPAYYHLYM
jgi:hypothetical protein